jgi:hypothetical protein
MEVAKAGAEEPRPSPVQGTGKAHSVVPALTTSPLRGHVRRSRLDGGSLELAEQPLAQILSLDQLVAEVVVLRSGDLSSKIGEVVAKENA